MMAGVQLWLRSVLAVSLLCALADALTPQGGVKRVQRLVCGLVLAAAALGPAVRLDGEAGGGWRTAWRTWSSGGTSWRRRPG